MEFHVFHIKISVLMSCLVTNIKCEDYTLIDSPSVICRVLHYSLCIYLRDPCIKVMSLCYSVHRKLYS